MLKHKVHFIYFKHKTNLWKLHSNICNKKGNINRKSGIMMLQMEFLFGNQAIWDLDILRLSIKKTTDRVLAVCRAAHHTLGYKW